MEHIGRLFWSKTESAIRWTLLHVLHLELDKQKWEALMQFVKFSLVGLSNTVISYVVFLIGMFLFQTLGILQNVDYLVSQFLGFLISVLWSFTLNRRYVFQVDETEVPCYRALLKTYVSYAFTGVFLNSVLAIVWVEWLGIPKLIAPIFNLLISVPINFLLNKFWAFRTTK